MLKNFFWICVESIIIFLDNITTLFKENNIASLIFHVCKALESETLYISYQIRPKNTGEIPILTDLNQSRSFAIVLQGPICTKDEMTLNSIRFYRKVYPYAIIIVSTWNDEPEDELNKLKKLGAIIIKSEKPLNQGTLNINYQLVNSLAGMKKAKELGCEYAVKTRTDQRVCKPYIFDAMLAALKIFPCTGSSKGRLVTLGVRGGGMFIPFHTCDFLYLGYTEDLIQLFSIPFDQRIYDEKLRQRLGQLSRRQLSEQMIPPEVYILKHYCSDILKLGCEDTVESYWYVMKNYLICFGMKDVDLMWNKYETMYDLNFCSSSYFGEMDSSERLSTMCFDFFNWMNLYMDNIKYKKEYEKYADMELDISNDDRKNH